MLCEDVFWFDTVAEMDCMAEYVCLRIVFLCLMFMLNRNITDIHVAVR